MFITKKMLQRGFEGGGVKSIDVAVEKGDKPLLTHTMRMEVLIGV
jgi:hypothetical protein